VEISREVGVHKVLQAWDDVQRKVKPPEKPYDYQRARPLNQEKSTRSLAEVYAEEYVEKTKESQPTETEDVRHVELEKLKNTLFVKLDALANFYFTPKPPHSEPCVVSNVSAVVMEEALPTATAQHTLLAPEEVQVRVVAAK
jgi:U3 small nucleolar RNA-associated protein MPP10